MFTRALERAKLKAALPTPYGCGLFKATDQAGIAWWASVGACLTDPLLFKLRDGLSRFAGAAYQTVVNLHGGSGSKFWSQVKHLYPDSALGLLNGTFYSPLHKHTAKTNQIALKSVSKMKLESYKKMILCLYCLKIIPHSHLVMLSMRPAALLLEKFLVSPSNSQTYFQCC